MKVLFCGDIVGVAGRKVVLERIPELRRRLGLDFVAVNGENAAHGFGITPQICKDFYAAGIDAITLGNHAWDQREIIAYIDGDPRLLRPQNFPPGTPGRGAGVFATERGKRVLLIQVMGRQFMDALDDPFAGLERELSKHRLGHSVDTIILDVHAEATSEKMALAQVADGRVSLVVGTHSHVPTADARLLAGGSAMITDIGMCGDYDSVIGMKKEAAIARFVRKMPGERLSPAEGPGTFCAVYAETDDKTGLATRVVPIRLGGMLPDYWPF